MNRNNYLKRDRLFVLFSILAFIYLVGCEKQPQVEFGSTYVADNSGADIVVVDTSSVVMSTLFVDSTSTAGTGYLQVGQLKDPYFGTINSRAYWQITPPSGASVSVNDIYDSTSLILIFKKSNPFYGDTTLAQTLVVSQVDSLYQLGSYQNGWNSRNVLPIDPNPLGQTSVIIAPNIPYSNQGIGDTVKVHIRDDMGKQLFTMIYNNSDTITESTKWSAWFHGLCLSSSGVDAGQSTQTGAIYGFQDSAVLRIYYTKAAGAYGVASYLDFGITNKSYQFNNITTDRSASPLKNLATSASDATSGGSIPGAPPATLSSLTSNGGYVQPATGLTVKLTFPYLNAIALRQDFLSVLRAELTIRPDLNSFNTDWKLPPQLTIYSTDLHNLPLSAITSSSGTQTGSMTIDYLNLTNMYYTYDVTSLVKPLVTNVDPTAAEEGIIVTVPSPNNTNSFARAVLADQTFPVNQQIKLSVYYISLYPHN